MKAWWAAVAAASVVALAGCGGGSVKVSSPSAKASSKATSAPSPSKSWDCSPGGGLTMAQFTKHCKGVDNSTASPSVATSGSVTTADGSFVQYPNGVREEIIAVVVDDAYGQRNLEVGGEGSDPGHPNDGGLHITVKYTNNGSAAYQFVDESDIDSDLTFGANEYSAQQYFPDETLPAQLVPGTSATQTYDYTLPASEEHDNLRMTVTPDENTYTKYTFTDVQTLIH